MLSKLSNLRELTDNLIAKTHLFGLFITQQLIQYWF